MFQPWCLKSIMNEKLSELVDHVKKKDDKSAYNNLQVIWSLLNREVSASVVSE